MKYHEMWLAILITLAVFTSACNGGSEAATPAPTAAADPTPVATVEPADPEPTVTVAPEAPVVTDQDRIAAVVVALDAHIAAGEAPAGLFAYDLMDSRVDEDGIVTLTICGWTGDTVFDTVRDSIWTTAVDDDGTIEAQHRSTPVAVGECLNTQLINSALETANQYDEYWVEISTDPEKFESDERSALLAPRYLKSSAELVATWIKDGISYPGSRPAGTMSEGVVAEILWTRYRRSGVEVLELVFCRPMEEGFGSYRAGVLVDPERAADSPGLHSVDAYQFTAVEPEELGGWQVGGRQTLVWSDCFFTGDWPGAATAWREFDEPFKVLER